MTKEECKVNAEQWAAMLKTWRIDNNISLSGMAGRLDVDTSLLAKYESGEREIRLALLIQYLAELDIYLSPVKGLAKKIKEENKG